MSTAKSMLITLAVMSAAILGGCPAPTTDSTTTSADTSGGTTEAPPVAVHDDSAASTNNVGSGSNDVATTTTSGSDTGSTTGSTNTTTTTTDPNVPTIDPATPPPSSTNTGTYTATVTWQHSQFLAGGDRDAISSENAPLTVTFDQNGVMEDVYFPGFVSAPDGVAPVKFVGDQATITPAADPEVTQIVTLLEADYNGNTIFLKLRVKHTRQGSGVETGKGIQTIDITVNGDTLSYQSTMTYNVTLSGSGAGSLAFDTGEISTATATLVRQ